MPVQNPFGLSFSGNITQWDNTPLSPPSAFGTCPGLGCCSTVTAAIPVNASLFVGSCTALSATLAGSPPVEALNVNVVNPLTVTFTESSLPVTQATSPWVVSGTVAISNASICVTQCTSPWVVSGTVAFSNTTIAVTNTGTFAVQATQAGTWTVQQGGAPWSVTIPTPTDWGTAPATSVLVPAVNAEMFVGQNAVSGTSPVPVSATTAANNAGNPIFVDVTNFPATSTFQGNLTNNNAAPNAFNVGVLPAIAETAYTTITYTTGDQVLPVTDLHGALNVDWQALAGAALGGPTIWATAPTGEEVQGVNAYCFQGTSPWVVSLASTTITGTVAVTQSGTWTVQQGGAPWTFVGNLTNNNAAPAATNIGVLPAIAETAYNTITYTTGDQVLPVTDLHGALNQDLQAVAGVPLGATAVVPYGSTPAGVNVPAVNAFITNTPAVTVSGTVAVTQSTSPWVVSGTVTATIATPTDWGTAPATSVLVPAVNAENFIGQTALAAVSNYGTAPSAVAAQGVNAFVTNFPTTFGITGTVAVTQSTSPWVVSLTSTTITGTVVVDGALTNNNAAPTATLLGVLPAIAETAYNTVTYTTGDMVLPVTDLHGALNQDLQAVAGVQLGATAVVAFGSAPAAVNVPAVNASLFSGVTPLTNTGGALNTNITGGSVAVTQGTSPWVVSLTSTTITGTTTVAGNLTNNNAAPAANNVGVLPAIAESAYTNLTYTSGDQVLPATDLHGALMSDLEAVAGVALGATAVVNYGSTPAAVAVPAVNAFITNTPAVTVSGTVAVTQSTSPWVVSLASTTITGTVTTQGNLTNNNAAPAATNLGVLPAIAEATYTTLAYTTGDQVLPATDSHGALWSDLAAVAGTALGATGVTNFGSAPAAVAVPGVNASLFSGLTPLTNTGGALNVNVTNTTTSTVAGNLSNNTAAPIADNVGVLPAIAATSYTTQTYTNGDQVLLVTDLHGAINDDLQAVAGVQLGATAVVAYGSTPAAVNVPAVNAFITNNVTVIGAKTNNSAGPSTEVGVLPALANAASPSWTEGNQVLESVDLTGRQRVRGTLTNNNAAPTADNLGVLPALVAPTDTTFPTYTAGDQVLIVTDTHGNTNTDMQYWGGLDLGTPTNFGTTPGAVIVGQVNSSLFIGTVAAVAAAPGIQKVGISGSTGAAMDTTIGPSTAAANALQTAAVYNTTAPAATNGQSLAMQADTTGALFVNTEGRKQTYSASSVAFTPSGAGNVAALFGSATKTVRVTAIEVSLSTTATAGDVTLTIQKVSSAYTGQITGTMTTVPHDSNFSAGTASPACYTTVPTAGGTIVGQVRGIRALDSPSAFAPYRWTFGTEPGCSAIVLRGAAQGLAINLGSVISTQTVIVSIEWTEE